MMKKSFSSLTPLVDDVLSYMVNIRRDLHMHPELGFNEHRTAKIIATELKRLNYQVETGVGKTGVVGVLHGKQSKPVVMLRFDMDALPIEEANDVPYKSLNAGVMHACGHDGHVAIGLGVANVLAQLRDNLYGVVKLVFQPAEEGLGGAKAMIADGVLEEPAPEFCLGLHLWNEKEFGWLGVSPGPVMAGADMFEIEIAGIGGHGAAPHQTTDVIFVAMQVINQFQGIVSRKVNPREPAVISVTSVKAGETYNVIPASVRIKGTIRTFSRSTRDLILTYISRVLDNTVATFDCSATFKVVESVPPVVNDYEVTNLVQRTVQEIYPDNILDDDERTMGSEDMAFYMETVPGCYIFVGSSNSEKGLTAKHHQADFDIDENALRVGAAILVGVTYNLLGNPH